MWHLEGYVRAASFGESGMRSGRGCISWTPRLVPSEPAMSSQVAFLSDVKPFLC